MIYHCKRHGETEVTKIEQYPKSEKFILACGCYALAMKV